jgi:hypothetical protein
MFQNKIGCLLRFLCLLFRFRCLCRSLIEPFLDLKSDAQKKANRAGDSRDEKPVRVSAPKKKSGNSDENYR